MTSWVRDRYSSILEPGLVKTMTKSDCEALGFKRNYLKSKSPVCAILNVKLAMLAFTKLHPSTKPTPKKADKTFKKDVTFPREIK